MRDIIRSHKKGLITVCAIVITIVAVAGYAMKRLNEPAFGTVISSGTASDEKTAQEYKQLLSSYMNLNYPGTYKLQDRQNEATKNYLQSWMLVAGQDKETGQSRKIVISISNLPEGGVKEGSSYKLYKAYPDLYTLSSYSLDKNIVVAKRTNPSYEYVFLWPYKNYLLTIALSAAGEDSLANNEIETVVNSVQWL